MCKRYYSFEQSTLLLLLSTGLFLEKSTHEMYAQEMSFPKYVDIDLSNNRIAVYIVL